MGNRRQLRRTASIALALALLTAGACSDDDEDTSSTDTTAAAPGTDGGDGGDDGAAAAADQIAASQEIVDRYLAPPENTGVTEPLSELPPTGMRIAWVGCPTGTCLSEGEALAEAAEEFGWTVEQTQYGLTPEEIQSAFNRAIDSAPDAIMSSAVPVDLTTDVRARMAEEDIPFFECCNLIPEGMENPPVSILGDQNWTSFLAELLVHWQIVQTDADVHNLLVTAPDFTILGIASEQYEDTLAELCGDTCSSTRLDITVADIGTRLPGQVVSALQRDPDINYVSFVGSGGFATGVAAAIREAGLQDQVRIVGTAPSVANFEAMLAGDEEMWVGFSEQIVGWRLADMFARHLVGDEVPLRASGPDDTSAAAWPTTQYLTAETWPVAEPWVAPEDFEDVLRDLWGVE